MTRGRPERLARPVLVFGGSGQVGRELLRALEPRATVVAPTHAEVDLTQPDRIRAVIREARPATIVNAAALTNVDRAEHEPELARALNEIAPATMAGEAKQVDALMVHYSTDYVFDGNRDTPYDEDAMPNPINRYGRSKLDGERAVSASGAAHMIIRTSWVYSRDGSGFVATLLRQLPAQRAIEVVADQVGSPTWSRSLARATVAMLDAVRDGDAPRPARDDWGVYHLGGSGAASRVAIARELIAAVVERGGDREIASTMIIPVSADEFGAPARRPRYSALSNGRAKRRFDVELSAWQSELRAMLRADS